MLTDDRESLGAPDRGGSPRRGLVEGEKGEKNRIQCASNDFVITFSFYASECHCLKSQQKEPDV